MLLTSIWKTISRWCLLQSPQQIATNSNPELADAERVDVILRSQDSANFVQSVLDSSTLLPWMQYRHTGGGYVDMNGTGREEWSACSLYGHVQLSYIDDGLGDSAYVVLDVAGKKVELDSEQEQLLEDFILQRIRERRAIPVEYS